MTTLDNRRGDVAVLVPAAGAGVRLGPGVPKALRPLRGEPLLSHAMRQLAAAPSVGCLVVASPPGHEQQVRELVAQGGMPALVVTGGPQRQDSVALALAMVPTEFEIVLIHDAARALVPASLVEEVAGAIRGGREAVIPVLPVTDTITQVDPAGCVTTTPDRTTLRAVQTPQGFRRDVLEAAHAKAPGHPPVTDDAALVLRLGHSVHTIPGSPQAMKITTGADFRLAELLLDHP